MHTTREETIAFLESNTNKDECWLWTGAVDEKGYGKIFYQGNPVLVHRLSAHLFLGMNLYSNIQALHKIICRNKNCWNPDHLYLGTNQENRRDAVKTGDAFNSTAAMRKLQTHCIHGHPLEGDNLYIAKDGRRRCATCRRNNAKRHDETKQFVLKLRNKTKEK
jgi:hypothetical protein